MLRRIAVQTDFAVIFLRRREQIPPRNEADAFVPEGEARIRADLKLSPETALIPFSAEKGTGRGELVSAIFRAIE